MRAPSTPGPFARDFEAYYAAGATWNAGGDPWSRDVWRVERTISGVDATRDELLPFVGPAASLPLWSLLARLPFALARSVWVAVLALALALLALGALRLGGVRPGIGEALCAIAFAALSGPRISALALGQVALLAAAALALALPALERRSPWAILAASIAALQPNLALPLATRFAAKRPAPAARRCGHAVPRGDARNRRRRRRTRCLRAPPRRSRRRANVSIVIQYALPAIAAAFHLAPAIALAIGTAIAILAIAAVAIVALRLRSQPL